jgi:adenylate cyclase class 2
VHFLGDRGGNPLRFSKFKEMVQGNTQNATIEIGIINTIKGKYFYASLLNMTKKEEVEVKVKVGESKVKDIKEKLLSMGAVLDEKVKETDIYFTAPHRDFIETKECLRIRERDGLTELTYKGPTNDAMKKRGQFWKPEFNVSISSERSDLESLLQFLDFKKVAEVIKDREKFTLGNQSVCMDKIEGIGWFLEVETIIDEENRDEALEENMSLLNKLGMDESDIVDLPYRDLVINK